MIRKDGHESQILDEDPSVTLLWTPRPDSRASCRIGRRIGAGGFAEVFEAELQLRQEPSPMRVALKRLLPGLRGDPLRRRQLRREAQIAAYLNHPNIVKVLSLIELGDESAVAMELVEGLQCNHLLHRLSRHGCRLRYEAIAHIAAGLYAALKYLESPFNGNRPVVHADVSLENLMLTTDGVLKLIDFGIAAEDGGAIGTERSEAGVSEEALTGLHQAAGKRPYRPPEGIPPHGPSSQSDLYAAGICFWELCSGWRFPVLPEGVGEREMGSLIAFAAAELPEPAWLLLKRCLSMDPRTRLRAADDGLALCQRLSSGNGVATELGQLVRAAMTLGGGEPGDPQPFERSSLIIRQDFFAALRARLQGAFGAQRVLTWGPISEDPAHPVDEGLSARLRQALDSGFVETPAGALLVRVHPHKLMGEACVVSIEPGPGLVYDRLAQALLRSLLCQSSR